MAGRLARGKRLWPAGALLSARTSSYPLPTTVSGTAAPALKVICSLQAGTASWSSCRNRTCHVLAHEAPADVTYRRRTNEDEVVHRAVGQNRAREARS